ncbi:MAG TPA: YdcF family protein [Longimicrobiaceae bacterium]|nr:YdcF family protein [Longimicrobiaceae bacterium]
MTPFHRRRLFAAAVPLVLLAGGWLLRGPILRAAASWLRVADAPARADAIYVLGGANIERPAAAADLYRAGWAPRVLLPAVQEDTLVKLGLMPRGQDVSAGFLRRAGVPDSAIEVLPRAGGSTSTADDALLLRAWAVRHRARRILLVTSDYHSRRARLLFRRAFDGTGVELRMEPVTSGAVPRDRWWRSEDGLATVVNEYAKLVRDFVSG